MDEMIERKEKLFFILISILIGIGIFMIIIAPTLLEG
jgi:hypothetical protein